MAKNEIGYKNLIKLTSLGFVEGMYGKYPRIDKELILKHHEGLIATTCCLGASIPQAILKKGEEEYYKKEIDIVDSAGVVADSVKEVLKKEKLLAPKNKPTHHFYVSDFTKSFEESTKFFFKNRISLEKKEIWL